MSLQELGKRVAVWRKEQGLNQTQLAASADLSRLTLSQLENSELLELGYTKVERLLACLNKTLTPVDKAPMPTLDDLLRDRESEINTTGHDANVTKRSR